MTLKELLVGFGTQVRSIWMIGLHAFAKRETRMYPEEPVYLPPRYRGRIVLTRDPDGEERCVACNLCAVACPVGCISLQKAVSTRFLDVFIEKAEHPFYRALGELARLTLAQWQSQLLIPVAVKPLFR